MLCTLCTLRPHSHCDFGRLVHLRALLLKPPIVPSCFPQPCPLPHNPALQPCPATLQSLAYMHAAAAVRTCAYKLTAPVRPEQLPLVRGRWQVDLLIA